MSWKILYFIIAPIISGIIGYMISGFVSFRDKKQKVYGEILPPLIKLAYDPDEKDKAKFNMSLHNLWLYGSENVTKIMDNAVSILLHPERDNITKALQETIVAVRNDLQVFPWQKKIKPDDVKHIYTKIKIEKNNLNSI